MAEKSIPEYLWINLLVCLTGDRRHDTAVIRNFCRFYKYSSRQVWDRTIAEALEVAPLEEVTLH